MRRRAAKVDANHGEIVKALRKGGCSVLSLASNGSGVPDLLALHRSSLRLIEVKDGSKPPSARRLTPDQVEFHAVWPVTILSSLDDVAAFLNNAK